MPDAAQRQELLSGGAHLVRASRPDEDSDQRDPPVGRQPVHHRQRRPAALLFRPHGHAETVRRVSAHRHIHRASGAGVADAHGEVDLPHPALGEGGQQCPLRTRRLGRHQRAARLLIQPVDYARPETRPGHVR
eukprot:scaffold5383_cov116-Isochrysis_galbana.AAC.2